MKMVGATAVTKKNELTALLEAALKLLSTYAEELNAIDGGNRLTYRTIQDWKIDAPL